MFRLPTCFGAFCAFLSCSACRHRSFSARFAALDRWRLPFFARGMRRLRKKKVSEGAWQGQKICLKSQTEVVRISRMLQAKRCVGSMMSKGKREKKPYGFDG